MRASGGGSSHSPALGVARCRLPRLVLALGCCCQLWRSVLRTIVPPLAIATLVHWKKNSRFARVLHSVPLAATGTGCRPLLCTQAVEERFDELVGDLLAPAPKGAEGNWQVLDATSSAQATIPCMFCRFCQAGDVCCTPYYLRPLERAVHIRSSTNIWGALNPARCGASMWCSFN